MTAQETMDMVRILLDDSRDWYPTLNLVISAINTAHRRKVQESYDKQDERALRPFYKVTDWIPDRTYISDILYPRACKMKYAQNINPANINQPPFTYATDDFSHNITYEDADTMFNYAAVGESDVQTFTRECQYTLYYDNVNNQAGVYFTADLNAINGGSELFKLWYIAQPREFLFAPTQSQLALPLQIPSEYHFEVCTMAAEILNDIDVNELERSTNASQQQLPIEALGSR